MSSYKEDDDFKCTGSSKVKYTKPQATQLQHQEHQKLVDKSEVARPAASGAAASVPGAPGTSTNPKRDEDAEERINFNQLLCDGVSELDLSKLHKNGLCTVEAVAFASTRQLTKIQGISQKKAEKLIEIAKRLVPTGFCTASILQEKRYNTISITSGSKNLDTLLQGGFETGSLIEIFGENNAGKTQICMTLAVTCQLPVDDGGAEGKCMYIDTEGAFRPERLLPIAERYGLEGQTVLENVVFARSFNTEHQEDLLTTAAALMSEQRFAVIIVDSATALFRTEFVGRAELYDRQTMLNQFLHRLRRISDEYGVAVVYTNQVVSDVSGIALFAGSSTKAVGGNIMGHASTTRLQLRKARGAKRICKVYSSAIIPESEAEFLITTGGIADPVD